MGFHIPDSPRPGHSHAPTWADGTCQTVSTGTSTSSDASTETTIEFRENFAAHRRRRRNAMIPIPVIDIVGSPRTPPIGLTTDHRLALLQFQEQLRRQGLMGESQDPKHPTSREASTDAGHGHLRLDIP
ncbi:hypothetical protein Poli38472_005541 [Pythium oligandrum]|uniref:Uncharacterized protein n=1 Tax=Pythium oligandrum TaxID=41045 RepID=A0A8K1FLQ5_PYTOL|nr:hypothetical protein Poli38472_005541 [Pythium oligandrum]|eukprot:TMW62923.1 hypothetical protein Poli38472_005541 [Pythium oligandrum]